ncbi:type 2 lanthipeptide synthetase LanM family protein [Streptomyces sp. A012304]|uniref:type 2 lanthipeptide synthetase LanM family protein n=1 Tax=Streptomyces sp. A012304 TaxID=375446 RepID=UPI00222FF89F|nr:type 2 lanthipeptide synthetase LanM family protein [Streptomyces sp. A012304]GKQ36401.1 lanthionine synthetase [Streptomyces sp. A012304]
MGVETQTATATETATAADPAWFLAHSLHERLHSTEPAGTVDPALGQLRLDLWRAEPFHARNPGALADHLRRLGTDENTLLRILGESPETVKRRFAEPPAYARRIEQAWRDYSHVPADTATTPTSSRGFAQIAAPLLRQAAERLRTGIADLVRNHARLDAAALTRELVKEPVDAIVQLVARTLVLELNVLRVRGSLAGDTPHERYHHFLQRLQNPAFALGVLREYPVLARDLVRAIDQWVDSRLEFTDRLVSDLGALEERCGGTDTLGTVAEVTFGAGDSHRGGRSVAVVRFVGGQKVMYKPRRLQVDQHFQELLAWLSARNPRIELRTFWVLDRDVYGWTEFVENSPCADRAAVGRFYERQGAYLALLHTLGAIDFHLENIIACGEHPLLIDLEALFHGWQVRLPDSFDKPREALELMHTSVKTVGLLPHPALWTEDNEVNQFDVSGMTGVGGQMTLLPVPAWEGGGTDEMRLVRKRVAMGQADNLPSLDGETPDVSQFRQELISGYRETYRTLWNHRDAMLAPGGPVAAFADDEIRIIVRPTQTYMQLLTEGRHPDLLRDALDRDRFHDNFRSGHEDHPHRAQLIAAELAQIRRGDVPIFTTTPSSRDIVCGDGSTIPDGLERSGFAIARERAAALSDDHLAQQIWFIEASLTALTMGDPSRWQPQARPTVVPRTVSGHASAGRFVDAARAIGDRLLKTAIVEGDRVCWLGLTLVGDKVWSLAPAGLDLFNGVSGIGLFLGQLGEVTGEARFRSAAERTAEVMVRQIETLADAPPEAMATHNVGAFGRLGGPVYALSHLAALWQREDLAEAAAHATAAMTQLIAADQSLDVIGGSAGGMLSLLSLHAMRPDPAILDAARAMARHLAETAEDTHGGLAWPAPMNARPLAGFSHGASGVATALARLDRRTGSHDHLDIVRSALRFERSVFDEVSGNWPDLRDDTPLGNDMVAWCHGAGGVGLARADLADYLGEDAPACEDLRHAALCVLDALPDGGGAPGTLGNHSICHGDLGNIESLLASAAVLGDSTLADRARTAAATVLADIETGGSRCGVPGGVETPGLMAGLAGIGHALLRLSGTRHIPSVLLLEEPFGDSRK